MKKYSAILALVLAMAMLFAACQAPAPTDAQTGTEAPAATEAAATEAAATEAAATEAAPATEAPLAAPTIESAEKVAGDHNVLYNATDPSKVPAAALARKDTIVVGFAAAEGQYNPHFSSSVDDAYICDLIFEGMVTNDIDGNPIPSTLLEKPWEVSEDQKTFTFTLRKDIKFSDGTPLTTADVEFTFRTLCDKSYDGPRMEAVQNLLGYKEYNEGSATTVEGIKVIDEYTISFTEAEVKAAAIWDFGHTILSKAYYDVAKGDVAKMKEKSTTPMGSGPYKLVSAKPSEMVELTINENYWDASKMPKVKNIVFKVVNNDTRMQDLASGAVDIDRIPSKPDFVEQALAEGFIGLQEYLANSYTYIGLNTKNDKLSDVRVRQALTYGLDRQGLLDIYSPGMATIPSAPFSISSWAYTDDVTKYEFSPEKAAALLDEAGWKLGADGIREKDGKKFTLILTAYTGSAYVDALVPLMTKCYKELGIDFTAELLEWGTCTEKVYKQQDFECYTMSWSLSIDPDPSGIWSEAQLAKDGFNAVGWAPKESIDLIKKGSVTTVQDERKAAYQEWAKLFSNECPYVLVSSPYEYFAVSARVKNFNKTQYRGLTTALLACEIAAE